MQQIVVVVNIKGDDALVSSDQSGCHGCEAKSSCAVLGGQQKTKLLMSIPNRLMAKVGDRLVLDMDDKAILYATFVLYGVPMLAFISSGLLVHFLATMMQLAHVDLWAVAGACIGMGLIWRVNALLDFKPTVRMLSFDTTGQPCPTTQKSEFIIKE